MTQEIENPMLLPEPTYTREARREVQIHLPEHRAQMDAWNERMAEKSREAAMKNGQANTARGA